MRGVQRQEHMYLVCLIIHAIFCMENTLPATMRSPSFSQPSSSMTTRNSPRANAAMASSMASNANAVRVGGLGTSWGRAGEAKAGMRGKSVGTETPLALRGERGADWGWAASAAGGEDSLSATVTAPLLQLEGVRQRRRTRRSS